MKLNTILTNLVSEDVEFCLVQMRKNPLSYLLGGKSYSCLSNVVFLIKIESFH